ncbi:hypothetical protein DIPPA_25720 [Diplonema papillatum]|nr:hypothetical protein DIPPA_25720 [Diplonema papillatum]
MPQTPGEDSELAQLLKWVEKEMQGDLGEDAEMQYHRAAPPRAMLTKRAATMAMEEHEQVMGRLASAAYAQGGARSVHKRCTAPLDDMPTARVDYSVVERGLSGRERSALRAYSEEPMMSDAKGASSMTSYALGRQQQGYLRSRKRMGKRADHT